MRQLVRCTFTALLYACPVVSFACGNEAWPSCSVVVAKDWFTAYFPVLKAQDVWHWRSADTPDNKMEYRWSVVLGECKKDGNFIAYKYTFGVELFKFPGQPPGSGDLSELLRHAQSDIMQSSSKGEATVYERLDQYHLSAISYDPSIIQVGSNQKEALDKLFASKPPQALMSASTLDPAQSYTCLAQVQYK